jgi:hypothetical protein
MDIGCFFRARAWRRLSKAPAAFPSALLLGAVLSLSACSSTGPGYAPAATRYAVDPYWPKPLPGKWQLGAVAGVAVDRHQHIWIIHRPSSFTDDEKAAAFDLSRAACVPAPSVVEFDPEGNVLRS